MLLTEVLLKHIGVDVNKEEQRNVVLLGCGTYGEIWAESDYCKQVQDQDDIRRKLEESGL
jgi:DNA-binding transcriptional regulator/RsmH inhibitor MraZ